MSLIAGFVLLAAAFALGPGLSDTQRAAFGRWMDQIYARFIGRVSEGRRMPLERVEAIARAIHQRPNIFRLGPVAALPIGFINIEATKVKRLPVGAEV